MLCFSENLANCTLVSDKDILHTKLGKKTIDNCFLFEGKISASLMFNII